MPGPSPLCDRLVNRLQTAMPLPVKCVTMVAKKIDRRTGTIDRNVNKLVHWLTPNAKRSQSGLCPINKKCSSRSQQLSAVVLRSNGDRENETGNLQAEGMTINGLDTNLLFEWENLKVYILNVNCNAYRYWNYLWILQWAKILSCPNN